MTDKVIDENGWQIVGKRKIKRNGTYAGNLSSPSQSERCSESSVEIKFLFSYSGFFIDGTDILSKDIIIRCTAKDGHCLSPER
jgi:hypothetical protein